MIIRFISIVIFYSSEFTLNNFSFPYLIVKRPDVESVILCGIETHACIHHTTLELIDQGMKHGT